LCSTKVQNDQKIYPFIIREEEEEEETTDYDFYFSFVSN